MRAKIGLLLAWAMGSAVSAKAAEPSASVVETSKPAPQLLSSPDGLTQPLQPSVKLTDEQKVALSTERLAKMRTALKRMAGTAEEAQGTKDAVKLNCVNEKVTMVKGLLRAAEKSDAALSEAIRRKNKVAIDHEFNRISISQQKVERLRTSAEDCIGQLAFRTEDDTQVEVESPSNLPETDPTRPEPPSSIIVDPPIASPTM